MAVVCDPAHVEWRSQVWERCRHGCGLFSTEVAVIRAFVGSDQVVCVLCYACLWRTWVDPLFKMEVCQCL